MDVVTLLAADAEPAHPVQPSPRALHLPAMPPQALAGVDAPTCDSGPAMAQPQPSADETMSVGFVRVHFLRALARRAMRALHRLDVIEQRQRLLAVIDVGSAQRLRQRQALGAYHQMVRGALLAPVRWIGGR